MQSIGELAAQVFAGESVRETPRPGDYYGEDGRLRCGKCGGAREHRFPGGKIVPCACRCREQERALEAAEAERRRELRRVREMAGYSLADERMSGARFENFRADTPEDARILRICRNYVGRWDELYRRSAGLLFYGNPGTGKTFAAACIANALRERGVPVLVTSIVWLASGGFGDDLNETLDMMRSALLLVLDDFGAERDTEFMAERVFAVIDARYASKRPMIITTNITDFKSETDVRRMRIYDRILETCTTVRFVGASKRGEARHSSQREIRALLEAD